MGSQNEKFFTSGFILFELLISVAIAAVVALAAMAAFNGGINVYERVRVYGRVQADIFIALEKMESDIRNTFTIASIGFSGNANQLHCPAWVTLQDQENSWHNQIGRRSYYFDSKHGTVVMETQNYSQASAGAGIGDGDIETLAMAESLQFIYYYFDEESQSYNWKNSWSAQEGRPAGVRIDVTFQKNDKAAEIRRTVLLPTAG